MQDDIAEKIRRDAQFHDERAPNYGKKRDDFMHTITPEEEELYREDLREVLGPFAEYNSVLDVGAGTGLLTRLLDRWGCKGIVGIDISGEVLVEARKRSPNCRFQQIAQEADADLFPSGSFDLIISRQLACHLIDPIRVFECWRRWLTPHGNIAIIDGLWTRADWGTPSTPGGALADDRPLSCTQTTATATYLLERANLVVQHNKLLRRVNDFAKQRFTIGQRREPIIRFVIVATPPHCD